MQLKKIRTALGACTLLLNATFALAASPETTVPTANIAPCVSWKNPVGHPRIALLCIHGLGLYSKSYENFAQRLSKQGVAVYAIDVRGFGSWMQSKGNEDVNFEACLSDIKSALESIRQANPGLPVFLLGESMGGAIALRATSIYPELIDGCISSVPAAERFQAAQQTRKVARGVLRGPNKDINIGTQIINQAATAKRVQDGKTVCVVNEDLAQEWANDPLDRMELSPRELIHFQSFMRDNKEAVKKITTVPVLFVQGLDDNLVKPEGTWELAQAIATPDRMLVAIPSRHLVFEEMQSSDPRLAQGVTQMVLNWVAMHMPGMNAEDPANFGSNATASPPAGHTDTMPAVAPIAPAPQVTGGRPTILAFYANWAQQCGNVEQLVARCRTTFGDRVNCLKLDIHDSNSQQLMQYYKVGTIPTLVFLNGNGSVSSTLVGQSQFANIAKGLAGILGVRPESMAAGRPGLKRRAQLHAIGK